MLWPICGLLQNGALSAIPYIAFWAVINIGGNVVDCLRSRGLRTSLARKLSTAAGRCATIVAYHVASPFDQLKWSETSTCFPSLSISPFGTLLHLKYLITPNYTPCYPSGTLLPGVFLVATGHISCEHPYVAVTLLTVGIGLSGLQVRWYWE